MQTDNLIDELSVVPSNYRGEIIVALKFIPPPRQQSSSYSSKQSTKRRFRAEIRCITIHPLVEFEALGE